MEEEKLGEDTPDIMESLRGRCRRKTARPLQVRTGNLTFEPPAAARALRYSWLF